MISNEDLTAWLNSIKRDSTSYRASLQLKTSRQRQSELILGNKLVSYDAESDDIREAGAKDFLVVASPKSFTPDLKQRH